MDGEIEEVRSIITSLGKLEGLSPDEDFYAAGFSSVRALELLMELESRFDVAIPDDRFIAARTATGLSALIAELRDGGGA